MASKLFFLPAPTTASSKKLMTNPCSSRNLKRTTLTTTRPKKNTSCFMIKSSLSQASDPITINHSLHDPKLFDKAGEELRGKIIVARCSVGALESVESTLISDLVRLSHMGLKIVLVHDAPLELVHKVFELKSVDPSFIHDLVFLSNMGLKMAIRLHEPTHELVHKVYEPGKWLLQQWIKPHPLPMLSLPLSSEDEVNNRLVSQINEAGVTAIGFSVLDGELAHLWDATSIIQSLFKYNCIPVISSMVSAYRKGLNDPLVLNVFEGIGLAGGLASDLGAEKLIYFNDKVGILESQIGPVKELNSVKFGEMISNVEYDFEMDLEVIHSSLAIRFGAASASIVDGLLPHSLLLEVLTGGVGIKIT